MMNNGKNRRRIKISFLSGRVSYNQYPNLGLYDFFIYPIFYFSYIERRGYWGIINLFGKWRRFSNFKNLK